MPRRGSTGRFSGLERIHLDAAAWVDYAPEWVSGSDELFAQVLEERDWGQRSRRMYDGRVVEPRLTAPWNAGSGEELTPPLLEDIRATLSEHGRSRTFMLGRGDLLVTGGKTQRTWEHSVPKVAQAGPRISLAYRHGLDPRAYAHKKQEGRPE